MNEDSAISLLHKILAIDKLNDLQELVFRLSYQGKTYQQIAETLDYDHDYIRDIGFRLWRTLSQKLGVKVTKKNIHSVLNDYLVHQESGQNGLSLQSVIFSQQFRDWGEMKDTKIFYGRDRQLKEVTHWILQENCRLVGVFGIGGVGKTAFTAKLVAKIEKKFDYLIWRSVGNAPKIETLLVEVISFLSHQQDNELNLPKNIDGKLRQLLTYLREHKCLIVLDNFESLLQSCAGTYDGREGCYLNGYGGFEQLLEIIADTEHQSCLLITGREIPINFWSRSGENTATRYLQLSGLNIIEGKKLLQHQGKLVGSDRDWNKLINYYAGNPLALKIVATAIRELFTSNISDFWQTNIGLFGDINDLLAEQCDRLSQLEINLMYWLALSREAVTIAELQDKILGNIAASQLLTELQSLQQRSLVERNNLGFTLQPVVMEFFSQKFVTQIDFEITNNSPDLLNTHACLDASGKDYVKENQIKFFFLPSFNA